MSEENLDEFDFEEEEISCEEVDQILAKLSQIMEDVESDTIHEILDETYNQIFDLVYEAEEEAAEDAEFTDDDVESELEDLDEEDPQSEAA